MLTDRKPGGSRCYFLYPKCTKTHLLASVKSKISPGMIAPPPLKGHGVNGRQGREGAGERRERVAMSRPILGGNDANG